MWECDDCKQNQRDKGKADARVLELEKKLNDLEKFMSSLIMLNTDYINRLVGVLSSAGAK